MNPNHYNYQYYYNHLQNQPLVTSENSQNTLSYVMYPPVLELQILGGFVGQHVRCNCEQ
ncbi:hypothetical protein glysoja_045424 [Glycine soja]|uniref:Uncharacterized protein n=1 Tax=Glycine soja TaxID=3848 RepID=A0A0B2QX47_GLYSO|nr:hypothetical protein glysoja_045424 [Glycine soja]